ncbi:MAG: biotin/lipoyl-containing protein, partial [bacterium]
MAAEFKLPELGENVETGTVVKILVSKGAEIKKDQAIIELETEKALLEVPSNVGGVVKEILVKEGDEVKVGQTLLVLDGQVEKKKETRKETLEEKKTNEKEKQEDAPAAKQ